MSNIRIITYALDDDKDELYLLNFYLRSICGDDLHLYSDIEEFLKEIEHGAHICIIDHKLNAGIDGIEVGQRVLKKNPLAFLILYSGNACPKVWQTATNVGFSRLVDKNDPGCFDQIARMVEAQVPAIQERMDLYAMWCHKYEKYIG